jgi:hypothetical protein
LPDGIRCAQFRPPDFTRTAGYGQQMDALRSELREWFWDGTFRDTIGADVRSAGGQSHHPYAVYLHRDTGEPALAIPARSARAVAR